jgi:hypothetical protein
MNGNWKRAPNRSRIVLALAIGMILFANTPAWAAKPNKDIRDNWGSIQLTNTGAESQATGEASLAQVVMTPDPTPWGLSYDCSGRLTVKCQNLTPGATYWTAAGTFTANDKGVGRITGEVRFGFYVPGWGPPEPYVVVVDVVRLDPDGSRTTVLTGAF